MEGNEGDIDMSKITHVVLFSGGLGSWAAAKRVAMTHGLDNLILLFILICLYIILDR